ncbi:MAG: hypothetical protein A2469_04205 [Candidatus Magasanikbacteria bacterium RIFOXYC2_FULL_40_16]|uniref:HD/PDEase domain-containing protein n=3 Tax=Candidatus Magasanikiibacteriota TaxID=1752731 RepID=A0A1F6P174_9BACT|nr:MAG: hypothetical protein A2469_04205 [Candidatus Magasanikbacteria bacterium RIFOXYC2_FULL_40_16]
MLYYSDMDSRIEKLINNAKRRMKHCVDPVHGLDHVERVVSRVKELTMDLGLSAEERQAIILAAWWHDVSRSMTKKPSIIWMSIIDDTVSALMLWVKSISCGLFGETVGLATRIIVCKSFGTGAVLTRLLLRKKRRILVDLLDDADSLDMLNDERIARLLPFIENSRLYRISYKFVISWCLKGREFRLKTEQAKKMFIELIRKFIAWVKQKEIFDWHVKQFGEKWLAKALKDANDFLNRIIMETC